MKLFGRDKGDLAGDALPSGAFFDPGIDETLTQSNAFSLLGFSDTKNAGGDGGVTVDFRTDILIDGLRGLIGRVFDAGEKRAFIGETAIGLDADKGRSENLLESFGVLGFDGTIPGMFKSNDAASFIAGRILRERGEIGKE